MKKIIIVFLFLFNLSNAQVTSLDALNNFDQFFNDAVIFSDKFITPATDAAVYQAASGWIFSCKKRKLWSASFGIHTNLFLVPNSDREFLLQNSDFKFLKLQNETSAVIPSALGDDREINIIDIYGVINPAKPIKSPKGVNQKIIVYPHFSASLALWKQTEFILKFAPKTKINKGEYQVYGVGLKHNLSQYSKFFDKKKINLALLISKSNEKINFNFFDIQTNFGTLGINTINGDIDSWQFQVNASKEFGKFEIMLASITNKSDFEYNFSGEKGTIDNLIPFPGGSSQEYFNEKLKDIYKSKINSIVEVSATYNLNKFYFQSSFAFNKFLNSNLSVHYLLD